MYSVRLSVSRQIYSEEWQQLNNDKLLDVVKNGGVFVITYGRNTFCGTISEFALMCKHFVDYKHLPNNHFSMAVYVNGREYEIKRGFKPLLLNAIQEDK